MVARSTYIPRQGESNSLGWTCQQLGRTLDLQKPGTAIDLLGSPNDVGTGKADLVDPNYVPPLMLKYGKGWHDTSKTLNVLRDTGIIKE